MKRNLLKTMLVGIGLLAGTTLSMAYEAETLYEIGTTSNPWTETNISDLGSGPTLTAYGAYFTSSNGSNEFSKTIKPTSNSIINVDAYWYGMSNTGRQFSEGNGIYFRFGNIYIAQNDQNQKHGYGLDGITNMNTVTTFSGKNSYRNYDISTLKFLHIEIEINTAKNVLNYLKISEDGSDSYLVEITDQTLSEPDYTEIAFGYKKSGSVSTYQHNYLKSVKVTETKQDVTTANYTINYTNNGKTISSTTGNIAVGSSITAESVITVDGTKYLIVADEVPTLTVSGTEADNVLNVPVREPYTYTAYIVTSIDDVSSQTTKSFTETDDKVCTWSYAWPLYINNNGVYCKVDNKACVASGTFDAENNSGQISLKYTSDKNVVYFGEWETDCTSSGSTYPTSTVKGFSSNQGKAIQKNDYTMSLTFTVTEAGKYSITMPYYNSNSKSRKHTISIDDEVVENELEVAASTGGTFSYDADLTEGEHTVTIKCVYSLTSVFDYLLVEQIPTVTKTISTTTGYASFSSTSNVIVPAKVTVYTAAVSTDGNSVVLTAVSDGTNETIVPANNGVILYLKDGGEQTFEVTTTEASDFSNNALLATSNSEYTTVPSTGTYYALKANVAEFAKVNNGVTLSADKAYIKASDNAAKTLSIVFDDETTGINNVNAAAAQQNNTYFNLQGMKVEKPSKGLYIVNGKKVIVK